MQANFLAPINLVSANNNDIVPLHLYSFFFNISTSLSDVNLFNIVKRYSSTKKPSRIGNLSWDIQLGSYLAGLIEGDGSIYTPTSLRTGRGSIKNPFINVAFHINDLPLANLLCSCLGGSVQTKTSHCIWTVGALNELAFIVNLINGNMRTPKIEALARLISFFHLHYPDIAVDDLKPIDMSPIGSNAWLAYAYAN